MLERVCYRGARECAEALGVSRDTLIKIAKNDPAFPVIKIGPRNSLCLYPVEQIREWVVSRAASEATRSRDKRQREKNSYGNFKETKCNTRPQTLRGRKRNSA